jgi:PKD repeat protein
VIVVGDRAGYGDGVIASFSSTGAELWARTYNGSEYSSPWGVALDSSGNIYVVLDRHNGDDVGVIEFSPQGNLLRQVVLATETEPEYSWDIAIDSAGNVYVVGHDMQGGHPLVARLTSTLAPVWTEYLVSPDSWQECYRVVIAQDGSIYAIGTGATSYGNSSAAASFHLSSDGILIESSIYTGSNASNLVFNDAAVSSTGSVVFAGSCYGSPILISTPIPDVITLPPSGTWVTDNTVWTGYSVSPTTVTLDSYAPSAVVDNYDISYGEQAWFGRVTAPELNASIEYKTSAHDTSVFYFRGYVVGGQKPYTFSWTFGDGTLGDGKRITHTYSGPGLYPVVLTVYDKDGKLGFASAVVRVYGPPVIDWVDHSYPVLVNANTTFYAQASDPDGGEITSYAWDFGDGTSSVSGEPYMVHFYQVAGSCLLNLVVTDNEGDTASYQEVIDVIELPRDSVVRSRRVDSRLRVGFRGLV